ncbi:MAG: tetratricopeptide repeat protein [Planctomycetota bacterium]|nr:tetratricopeptide repeat protein [Planctomycetota bacterium]
MRRANKTATAAALAAWALIGLAGCTGHGQHTGKFKKEAQDRMNNVKAATAWDMAEQQFLSGDLTKALRTVDESISLNAKVARSFVLRGRILIEMGRLEEAMASLQEAQALDAESHQAHYYAGIVYERFSRFDKALEAYLAAAEHDATNPQYVIAASEMLIDAERLDEAEKLLTENRTTFEHNAGIRQTLGHIAKIRGDEDRAVELFEEASLLAPDDASILEDLARAQMRAGRYAEAEVGFRRLSERKEFDERRDLELARAQCLVQLDRPVEARELLQAIVSEPEGAADPAVWRELADVAITLKDSFRLKEAAQRMMSVAPRRPEGYAYMGLWQREQGKLAEAAKMLERAVELAPDDPSPSVLRALVLVELGRTVEAERVLERAVARHPASAEASGLLASIRSAESGSAVVSVPVGE